MANENENIPNEGEQSGEPAPHKSWLKHMGEEIREKFDELIEEAQNDGGEFSALGNGHINVVHDHHHDHDAKPETKPEEKPKEEEKDTPLFHDLDTEFPLSGGEADPV
jgi:hypothetical protein